MQKTFFIRYIGMIIFNLDIAQQFALLPTKRVDTLGGLIALKFTDEVTKIKYDVCIENEQTINDIYYILTCGVLTFLKENNFYNLEVYFSNTNEVIYRDRIFCTTQSKDNYTINNGKYILPNISNNDYITI